MKKSTLIMILSLVLAVALGVGGTLAYLQDTDEDVNVMTLGNVYIEQHEYERVQNEDGTYEMVTSEKYGEGYKLQEFTQGKPLYPAVGEVTDYGKIVAFDQLGEGASGSQAVLDGIQNAQDKFVLVENTGKSDAYVRTIFAFEMGTMEESRWDKIFMTSVASFTNNGDKPWKYTDIGTAVIDDNTYFLMEAVYTGADTRHVDGVLPAGEYTYCSLAQVYLKPEANNEDMVALDGNGNGTFDILVVSQAVQTQGFADAKTALDTAFGPITVDNNPWKANGEDLPNTPVFPVNASDADEMMAGLAEGADIIADKNLDGELIYESNAAIELDAKGATVQLNGAAYDGNTKAYSYFGLVPPAGEDVTLSNLNVTGTGFVEIGHYGQGGGDYTITNLKIVNLASTLATGNNGNVLGAAFCQYGNAVLKDCVMTGTTAADPAATPYDACFINSTNTLVDGGKYGKVYVFEHGKVTFTGAEIDVIDSYARGTSGELIIGNGAKVNTVNIKRTDDNVALTIGSGATVGTINYNGTAYTQAEWLAR